MNLLRRFPLLKNEAKKALFPSLFDALHQATQKKKALLNAVTRSLLFCPSQPAHATNSF